MGCNNNSFKMFVTLFAIGFIAFQVTAVELPSYIHMCGRRNPNFDQCTRDNFISMKELCRTGVPEIKLPSYQPLYIDTITLFNFNSSLIKAFLKNTYVNGMCDYKFNYFHTDIEKNHIDIDVTFDRIGINSTYHIDVRVLAPIVASGTVFISTENPSAKVGIDYKTVKKNHATHVYVSAIQLKLNIKGYDIIYGAVQSDRSLSELRKMLYSVIGNNKEEIIKTTTPYIEHIISKLIVKNANDVVTLLPYDQLLPDRD